MILKLPSSIVNFKDFSKNIVLIIQFYLGINIYFKSIIYLHKVI